MISNYTRLPRLPRAAALAAVAGLLVLGACGGGDSSAVPPPEVTPPQAQTVSLSMPASRILGNKPVTLTAVLGHNAAVSWTLAGGSPGTLSAASGASVTYTPPAAAVAAITPVTITATSGGVSASARLALTPDPRQRTGLALLAGSLGGSGLIDGSGSAARFNKIAAMDTDSNGNLVLADGEDLGGAIPIPPSAIRQVDPAGNVVTRTRPGIQFGHADGDSSSAQIGNSRNEEPHGLWLRKIAPDGATTTVVADPAFTMKPTAVFADADGNLFVSAKWPWSSLSSPKGGALYKVAQDGKVSLFAGASVPAAAGASTSTDGTGAAVTFFAPTLEGIDVNGNLFVSDNDKIRRITPQAMVSTVAALPAGLKAAPDGKVYSADAVQNVIYATDAAGNKSVVAGVPGALGTRLTALPAGLEHPAAIVPTGPNSFALISGAAVLRLLLPN